MEQLINAITQIGIVTRDAKAMVKRYEEIYGVGGWVVIDGEKGFDPAAKALGLTVRGKEVDFEITLAKAMVGSVEIELIQPLDDKSDYAIFLRERGEGVHHISVVTDVEKMKSVMDDRGISKLMSGTIPNVETFLYYDTVPELGMTIEIHDTENVSI